MQSLTNNNSPDEFSFLKPGNKIPDFKWLDESGNEFSSAGLLGKISLIILFAPDCRHCRDNFAYLEMNLFQKKHGHLNILAFGRGCDSDQIAAYRKKYGLSIQLIADPRNEIYQKFAEKAVPRNYLFSAEGLLLQSIRGFRSKDIDDLVRIVFTDVD
jgi:peroxiredoxin